MNKDGQIEEMAKDVSHSISWCDDEIPTVDCIGTAAALYGQGYHKQREGKWRLTAEPLGGHDVPCIECSACGDSWVLDGDFDFEVVLDYWHYCPTCGAQMKGGE